MYTSSVTTLDYIKLSDHNQIITRKRYYRRENNQNCSGQSCGALDTRHLTTRIFGQKGTVAPKLPSPQIDRVTGWSKLQRKHSVHDELRHADAVITREGRTKTVIFEQTVCVILRRTTRKPS